MSAHTLVTDASQVVLAGDWEGPGSWWPIFPIFWILIFVAVTVALMSRRSRCQSIAGARAGEAKLAERFAAGEITEQEYRERQAVLKEQRR